MRHDIAKPTQPIMFCLGCGYVLDGLASQQCPECGQTFDPTKDDTFRRPAEPLPKPHWAMRIAFPTATAAIGLAWYEAQNPGRTGDGPLYVSCAAFLLFLVGLPILLSRINHTRPTELGAAGAHWLLAGALMFLYAVKDPCADIHDEFDFAAWMGLIMLGSLTSTYLWYYRLRVSAIAVLLFWATQVMLAIGNLMMLTAGYGLFQRWIS